MKPTVKIVRLPEFDRVKFTPSTLASAVMAGGQVIESYAKINVEGIFSGKSTGGAGLGGSIQTVVTKSTKTKAEASVGPTVVYGRIHELGGVIKTVHAKFLHFFVDGVEVFAKLVHIPARPYLRPAADEHKDDALRAIAGVLASAIGRGNLSGSLPKFEDAPAPVRKPRKPKEVTSWGNDEIQGRRD